MIYNTESKPKSKSNILYSTSGPQPFGHQGPKGFMEDSFSTDGGWGDGFRMIQVHYIYCALYFYYYYISSTSDHQALDSRGWGPRFPFLVLFLIFGSCLLTNFIA